MKKLFLTLALAFVGIFSANAQLWIGGGANGHFKDGFTVSVAPEIGYSFTDTPISVASAFNLILTKNELTNNEVNWGLVASPYVRCNLATVANKFNVFLDATGDFYIPNGGWRVGLQPGVAWMATEHWTAACRLGFLGYNKCPFLGEEGFGFNLQAALPAIYLYYNF